jgi:hypothetical protein
MSQLSHIMAKKVHCGHGHSKNALLAVDDQRGIAETLEENPEAGYAPLDDAPLQPLSKVHYVGEWIGVLGGH